MGLRNDLMAGDPCSESSLSKQKAPSTIFPPEERYRPVTMHGCPIHGFDWEKLEAVAMVKFEISREFLVHTGACFWTASDDADVAVGVQVHVSGLGPSHSNRHYHRYCEDRSVEPLMRGACNLPLFPVWRVKRPFAQHFESSPH